MKRIQPSQLAFRDLDAFCRGFTYMRVREDERLTTGFVKPSSRTVHPSLLTW